MDDTKSRRLTTKQQKAAARQALKSRRSGRATSGLDALDESEPGNNKNDNVVDTYTEEEYKEYCERQLQREDFVVDDGKLLISLLFCCLGGGGC